MIIMVRYRLEYEIAEIALDRLASLEGASFSSENRVAAQKIIEAAVIEGMRSCCQENAMIVESHLQRNKELASRINEAVEGRYKSLISNLGALR